MKDYIVCAFGEVVVPDPVFNMATVRALRKYREQGIVKVDEYRRKLIYRWARATAYYLWKTQ